MKLKDIRKAMKHHINVWYTDNDGEGFEAEIESIDEKAMFMSV